MDWDDREGLQGLAGSMRRKGIIRKNKEVKEIDK